METLEFSQEELKIIVAVFNQISIKLSDSILMIPIAEKVQAKIHPPVSVEAQPAPDAPIEGHTVLDSATN